MSQLANDWLNLLVVLPPSDRAEIAQRLIESLDGPADADWEAAWAEEVQKRAERMKSGAVQGMPFDEVIAKLRLKHSQAENPWLKIAGIFKDDPFMEEWKQAMAEYRNQIEKDDNYR